MPGYLSVSVEGLDEIIDSFDALEAQIDRASTRAKNKVLPGKLREALRLMIRCRCVLCTRTRGARIDTKSGCSFCWLIAGALVMRPYGLDTTR